MDKKQKLIEALEDENKKLLEVNAFGEKTNFKDYELTIEFLKSGTKPYRYLDYDLLACAVEDLETLYSDYGIE